MNTLLFLSITVALGSPTVESWPAFRGNGHSVSDAQDLPLRWSSDEGVAWQAPLPGYGQSSPVVWKNRVFVTCVEGAQKETLHLACIELRSGKALWTKQLPASQKEANDGYHSKAAPTPAVDARRVYAFWETGDLVAFDHAGALDWQRSLTHEYGPFRGNHGLGSSIALSEKAVIVLVAHGGDCYLLAVDRNSGKNTWKVAQPSGAGWSSPVVTRLGNREVVLVSISGRVEAYSASDGARLWSFTGIEGNNVPSPAVAGEHIVVGSRVPGSNLALSSDGKKKSPPKVAWKAMGVTSSFGSPLAYRDSAYFVNRPGVVTCVELTTGKKHWQHRLSKSCWASPLGAGDRVYFFAQNGKTTVLRAGDKLEVLAENTLTVEGRVYGVAAVDRRLVIRTGSKLICVGK